MQISTSGTSTAGTISMTTVAAGFVDPSTPQLETMRSRLRLLLDAHMGQLQPEILRPELDAVVIEQGAIAESLLLVNRGRLAVEVDQPPAAVRTLAVVNAGDLLGEMALFGDGHHTARVRVIDAPAELLRISRDALLQAVLFDSELTAAILELSLERCRSSNSWTSLLLSAISACAESNAPALESICDQLGQGPSSMADAATMLKRLFSAVESESC